MRNFNRCSRTVAEALYDRFKPHLFGGVAQNSLVEGGYIMLHDICIALTLLSRIDPDKKIEILFNLTDIDEDGCLSLEEIANMIDVIERVFQKENIHINLNSSVLFQQLAKSKAKRKFKQSFQNKLKLKLNKQEDGLIIFEEFRIALNTMIHIKDGFLPGSLHLKSVLQNNKKERTYDISEVGLPDFLMFRYELHAVLQRPEMMEKKDFMQGAQFLSNLDEGQDVPTFINRPSQVGTGSSTIQQLAKQKKKDEGTSKGGIKKYLPGLTPFSRTHLIKPQALEPILDINPKTQKIYVRDQKNDMQIKQATDSKHAEIQLSIKPLEKTEAFSVLKPISEARIIGQELGVDVTKFIEMDQKQQDMDRIGKDATFAESDRVVAKAKDKLAKVKDTAQELDSKFDQMLNQMNKKRQKNQKQQGNQGQKYSTR